MIRRFEEFSASISSIYRQIQKIERSEMAAYGLKGPHVQCMVALSRNPEGLTATDLCRICEKDKAAISRTVAELEKAGMVTRQDEGSRRYRVRIQMTPKGEQVAHQVTMLAARAVEQAGNGLEEAERAVFYRVLNLIASNLRQISQNGLREAAEE